MAERISIPQGIEHWIRVKKDSLPATESNAEWIAVLYNRSSNRRFMATKTTEGVYFKFTWESGVHYDEEQKCYIINPSATHSTAHMPEGVYELELITSDYKMIAVNKVKGQYEVVKSSVMAKNPS